jgi:hypothetical protein
LRFLNQARKMPPRLGGLDMLSVAGGIALFCIAVGLLNLFSQP